MGGRALHHNRRLMGEVMLAKGNLMLTLCHAQSKVMLTLGAMLNLTGAHFGDLGRGWYCKNTSTLQEKFWTFWLLESK